MAHFSAEDFRGTNAPKEMIQYIIDTIPDFHERYNLAINVMAHNRCPIYRADQDLFMEMLDCVDDWCNDNEDNSDLYMVEEIFG